MNANDALRELRLNAGRLINMLKPEFKFHPGDDVDLDDSFRLAAEELAAGFIAIDAQAQKKNLPDSWKPADVAPAPPPRIMTREEQIDEVREKAKNLGFRLVLHPPTNPRKKRSG